MIVDVEKTIELGKVLLVAGGPELRDSVERVAPAAQVVAEDSPLTGLLRLSREAFELAVVRVPRQAADLEAALGAFRRVRPELRIVLLTDMFDEPVALNLTQRGRADDYLLLPLRAPELDRVLRKFFRPKPSVSAAVRVEPAAVLPYSRLVDKSEPAAPANADLSGLLVRELTELIQTAELGLNDLLERVCWSAVFLCKARAARVRVGDESAHVGAEEATYDVILPLVEGETQIGQLEVATGDGPVSCSMVAGYLEQLIPGLIRLASSRGKLQELANTDPLTGLANRRRLQESLEALLVRARQERSRVTVVLFDFDDFKHYNDAYGHGAGDEILRESALLMKRCIRRKDLAARYGGDEFAVVLWDAQERRLPNSEHPRSAMVIMERFRKLLRDHYFPRLGPQAQGALTISGGLASFPWDAPDAVTLLERADGALLEAKRSGKDRIYLVGQGPEAGSNS